jgi:hypothetical protein
MQVKGSPPATKRSFLERKGLTAAEIDEAFRRVPDDVPTSSSSTPMPSQQPGAQGSGLVTYVQQPQAPAMQPPQLQQRQQQESMQLAVPQPPQAPPPPEPLRWSQVRHNGQRRGLPLPAPSPFKPDPKPSYARMQVVLGMGVVAVGVYALHTVVTPYLSNLYHSWTAAARARQEEQERQAQEVRESVAALNKVQSQMLIAVEHMAEVAKSLREQAAR